MCIRDRDGRRRHRRQVRARLHRRLPRRLGLLPRPPHRPLRESHSMTAVPTPLDDPTTTRIVSGDTEAIFVPGHGMLGISLRHKAVEFLRRIDDLKTYAALNRTAGIPSLFPWANRLAGFQYEVAGHENRLGVARDDPRC